MVVLVDNVGIHQGCLFISSTLVLLGSSSISLCSQQPLFLSLSGSSVFALGLVASVEHYILAMRLYHGA